MREDVEPLLTARRGRRRRRRRRRAARHGRLVARARGAAARRSASSASTSSTRRTRRRSASSRRSSTSSARSSSPRRSRARRSRRARTPTTSGSSRRAASSGSRSPTPARRSQQLAHERKFAAVFPGEPTIGGRYSALSPFGLVPGGADRRRRRGLLDRALRDGRRLPARRGQPRPRARALARRGLAATAATRSACPNAGRLRPLGRAADRRVDRQAGQGARARRPASRADGPDRQVQEVRLPDPLELGQEFFRWEFATAVAGVDPRDQPVRPARRAGGEGQDERGARGAATSTLEPRGLGRRAARAARSRATTSASRRSSNPTAGERRARSRGSPRALGRATGCVVTHGFGPRYLHSTGQLHKGGPNTGVFLQVVEDYGAELPIPGQPFGFAPADPRAGRRRLRVAARARPPRRAHPTGGGRLMQLGMIGLGRMGGNMTTRLDARPATT